jgi:hypothetical protein
MSRSLWRCRNRACPAPYGTVLGLLTGNGGLRLDPAITTFVVYLDTDRVTVTCPVCGTQRDFRGSFVSGPSHR